MDPDEALKQLRQMAIKVRRENGYLPFTADEMAEQFQALDSWLQQGGFLPRDWDRRTWGLSEPLIDRKEG